MRVTFDEAKPLLCAQVQRTLARINIFPTESALSNYVDYSFAGAERTFLSDSKTCGSALVEFHRLAWDSKIYGLEIGTVGALTSISHQGQFPQEESIAEELTAHLVENAKREGIKMLVVRVPLDDLAWVQAVEKFGFQSMDVQLPMMLRNPTATSDSSRTRNTNVQIREFAAHDLPEILSFAQTAFGRSRFYADRFLPRKLSDQLHQEWIENDCAGRASFVLVAVADNRVCGLVAGLWDKMQEQLLSVKHGHVDLIAVRSDMHKRGIARQLMSAAIQRYVDHGAGIITVSTQATNLAAISLYQSIGFTLTGAELSLHGWLE